jgi:FkbM family methyltransferase
LERNLSRFGALARTLLGEEVRWIVEVGARDCRETLGFRSLFPSARILAFECNPDTLPTCRTAVANDPAITLVEKAVAERPGRLKFFPVDPSTNPGASSLFRASGSYALERYEQREVEVEAVTLASALEHQGIPRVDLLWMDIQGAELRALEGLGARLADTALIHTEVEFEEIYADQPLFGDVYRFLLDRGFSFLGFTIYAKHSADAVFANRARFSVWDRTGALLAQPLLVRKRLQYSRHRLKRHLFGP